MAGKEPLIDAYIDNAAPFARPILKHIRKVMHKGCPDLEEKIKWGMPHFDYKGPMCGMAAFQKHCSFGFWKASLILSGDADSERDGMGHFGRLTSLSDLPDEKTLLGYIRKAMALNDAGIKAPTHSKPKAKPLPLKVPGYFVAALKRNKKAQQSFESFSYSYRKEYVEWVSEAKREATREQRLKTAIEWLAEGKSRNWKYQPK